MTNQRSYDERRANPDPCGCGRLVTRPDLCVREGCCLLDRHPAARVAKVTPPTDTDLHLWIVVVVTLLLAVGTAWP